MWLRSFYFIVHVNVIICDHCTLHWTQIKQKDTPYIFAQLVMIRILESFLIPCSFCCVTNRIIITENGHYNGLLSVLLFKMGTMTCW